MPSVKMWACDFEKEFIQRITYVLRHWLKPWKILRKDNIVLRHGLKPWKEIKKGQHSMET